MSAHELAVFSSWFLNFEAEFWDREIEADAISGRLERLAALALREHDQGQTTDL